MSNHSKFKIIYILLLQSILSVIPIWDFDNSSIDLLSIKNPYSYNIYNKDINGISLIKTITKSDNNINIKNEINYNSGSIKEVTFENINSTYFGEFGLSSSNLICPKGKFHPYDIRNNENKTFSDFKEKGDWDLKCIKHANGYFLVFYLNNKESNFFSYKSGTKKTISSIKNDLFDLELTDFYNSACNYEYKFVYIYSNNTNIILSGALLILNTDEYEPHLNPQKKKEIINNKTYSQAYFDKKTPNKFLYFFTYSTVSDFSCGYCTSPFSSTNYIDFSSFNKIIHNASRIEFIDEVKINKINFIQGTKYLYYEIENINTKKIYHGFMDVILNKVLYNTDENIIKFIPYSDTEMLAITDKSAYRICIIKDGNNCLTECPTGKNLVLDISGNKCKSDTSCDDGKIKLIPNEVCINICDENIFIYNPTTNECGLCKDFYPLDKKYKLINTTGCLSNEPENAEKYNSNTHLFLYKCKKGFHPYQQQCVPDSCFPLCKSCLESSDDINNQKCISCNDGYYLKDSNCIKCDNNNCETCNKESNGKKLCTKCKEGYITVNNTRLNPKYFYCLEEGDKILKKFYKDDNDIYKPCYQSCKECLKGSNEESNNCIECEIGYMSRPGFNPKNNCVIDSIYSYIDIYGNFRPLPNSQCPIDAPYKTKYKNSNKTVCFYDCKDSKDHLFLYNGNCLENCPDNTTKKGNKCFVDNTKCTLEKDDIYIEPDDNMTVVETLVTTYAYEFNYTKNHISFYENKNFSIIIYKNDSCIKEKYIPMPLINFKNCSNIIKQIYNISEFIYAVVDKKGKGNPKSFFDLFHPISGLKLDANKYCNNTSISIIENLYSILSTGNKTKKQYDLQVYYAEHGINIFDINHDFFCDICYEFDNPLDKDIPLKDRQKDIYPEATLCDEGCHNEGLDLNKMAATCNCKYRDISNSNLEPLLNDIFGDLYEILGSSNIEVLKCKNNFFNHIINSVGGIISIILIISNITFTVLFFVFDLTKIKKYIFNLTDNYILYLKKYNKTKEKENPPKNTNNPRKNKKNATTKPNKTKMRKITLDVRNHSNSLSASKDIVIAFKNKEAKSEIKLNPEIENEKEKEKNIDKEKNVGINILNTQNMGKKFFKEYLTPSVDDMEYDDAIVMDKRKFMEIFCDILKDKQMIMNTFVQKENLKPRSIKIILLILDICLNLVVIGLFFSEEYLSELYNSDEEDNFFSFFPRTIDKLVYTTFITMVVGFIFNFFFLEEKKIIGIFNREKNDKNALKENIVIFIKNLQRRYISFIILVFIILIFTFYYIVSFNRVYPKTQIEWLKSSIVIIIFSQIISIFKCIYESGLRSLSFRIQSEKLYKFSKIFD